ncbi:S-adenosyl-L-methionine-dependent methyltransferase [Cladochytrium replicatum]|nr:S-adenosyl-L-methionine-dependent methyltransferase [Cladochytrium replicatum]
MGSHSAEVLQREGRQGWDTLWKEQYTPWDLGGPTPALARLLSSSPPHLALSPGANVLIPGCGGGNDVIQVAKSGRTVVGLDLSETAIAAAEERAMAQGPYPHNPPTLVCGDFFTALFGETFDTIFDYTFFCALPPVLRPKWGSRMLDLLKPGGYLICIMYPLSPKDSVLEGPPFPVWFEAYEDVLSPGFELVEQIEVDSHESHERRKGRENMCIWRKK